MFFVKVSFHENLMMATQSLKLFLPNFYPIPIPFPESFIEISSKSGLKIETKVFLESKILKRKLSLKNYGKCRNVSG